MIIVETEAVAPFFKNGFVVSCPRTRQGVLIDPGDEVQGLLDYVGPLVETEIHEKPMSIALREINEGLLTSEPTES